MARTTEMDPATETQTERREAPAGASQQTPASGGTPTTGGMTDTKATSGAGAGSPLGAGSQGGPAGTHATQAGTEGQMGRGQSSQGGGQSSQGLGQSGAQGLGSSAQGGTGSLGRAGSQGGELGHGGTGQGMTRGGTGGSALSRPGDFFQSLGFDSPFRMMRRMVDEMDRLFEGFPFGQGRQTGYGGLSRGSGSGLGGFGGGLGESLWAPQIEVSQRGDNLVVCADLPGLQKEDLHVEVQDNNLILQGERRNERKDEREGYYASERSYGRFYRSIPLPEGVNPELANASFRDGVLEITLPLPQQEQQRGRKIDIR